jgi:NAD-dependent SIR2 family protein deacetylase
MKEFETIKPLIENLRAIERFNCYRCGWRLHEDEIREGDARQYCSSCVETMQKNDIEKDSDALQDKRVKKNNSKVEK